MTCKNLTSITKMKIRWKSSVIFERRKLITKCNLLTFQEILVQFFNNHGPNISWLGPAHGPIDAGVNFVGLEGPEKNKVVVIGDGVDAVKLTSCLRKKVGQTEILTVENVK